MDNIMEKPLAFVLLSAVFSVIYFAGLDFFEFLFEMGNLEDQGQTHPMIWSIRAALCASLASFLIFFGTIPIKKLLMAVAIETVIGVLLFWLLTQNFVVDPSYRQKSNLFFAKMLVYLGFVLAQPFVENACKNGRKLDYDTIYQSAITLAIRGGISAVIAVIGFLLFIVITNSLFKMRLMPHMDETTLLPYVFGLFFGLFMSLFVLQQNSVHVIYKVLALLALAFYPLFFVTSLIVDFGLIRHFLSGNQGNFIRNYSQTAFMVFVILFSFALMLLAHDRISPFVEKHAGRASAKIAIWAQRIFAIALIPLAIVALWGIAVRITDYGFTPERIYSLSFVLAASAFVFALGVLALFPKTRSIALERAAVFTVLLMIVFLAMMPILNVFKISAYSQLSRFLDGAELREISYGDLRNSWGKFGQEVADNIRNLDDPRIAEANSRSPNWWEDGRIPKYYGSPSKPRTRDEYEKIVNQIPVYRGTSRASADENLADMFGGRNSVDWVGRACESENCVVLIYDRNPFYKGDELNLFMIVDEQKVVLHKFIMRLNGLYFRESIVETIDLSPQDAEALLSGDFALETQEIERLSVGGKMMDLKD